MKLAANAGVYCWRDVRGDSLVLHRTVSFRWFFVGMAVGKMKKLLYK